MLAFGRPTIPKKAWPGSRDLFQNSKPPLNFSGMAEDRIVKFCARVDARSISLAMMTDCPPAASWAWLRSRDVLIFGK